jgi:Fe-S-cluster containining protein
LPFQHAEALKLTGEVHNSSWLVMTKPRIGYAVFGKMNIVYPYNLRWKCVRCATCCGDTEKHTRHVLILASEARAIAAETDMRVEEFAQRLKFEPYKFEIRKKNNRCVFLNGVSCSIYSKRPLVCRFYPFVMNRSESGTFEFKLPEHECQGIGRGRKLTQHYYLRLFRIAVERLELHCPE